MTDSPSVAVGSMVEDLARRGLRAGWLLSLYPTALEAGGSFRYSLAPRPHVRSGGPAADPQRAAEEAARRARGMARRYCAANRLNRLGTLTYRGDGCHDPKALRVDVARFWRSLRASLGGRPFPYLWTAEWHKSGHGLHVHFAVGKYIKRGLIERAWPHGFVHIKLLTDLPVGSASVDESRLAARYLSKYVAKDFDSTRMAGRHRYELAQGFQPKVVPVWAATRGDAISAASTLLKAAPAVIWTSDEKNDWQGPPALWLQWRG